MLSSKLLPALLLVATVSSVLGEHDCSVLDRRLSKRYAGIIAHGLHSMTLDKMRTIIPDIDPQDVVPSVSKNVRKDRTALLYHLPKELRSPFLSGPMKSIDNILSKMDLTDYGVPGYSSLEKVVHHFHMEEMWWRAFRTFKTTSYPSVNTCRCLLDVDNNGVIKRLKFVEDQLKEGLRHAGPYDYSNNVYDYTFVAREAYYLDKSKKIHIPKLQSSQAWKTWKDVMFRMGYTDDMEFALYLKCLEASVHQRLSSRMRFDYNLASNFAGNFTMVKNDCNKTNQNDFYNTGYNCSSVVIQYECNNAGQCLNNLRIEEQRLVADVSCTVQRNFYNNFGIQCFNSKTYVKSEFTVTINTENPLFEVLSAS